MTPLSELDQRLLVVQYRWRLRDALLAASQVVLVMAPAWVVLAWLDYRLDFSPWTRAVELAALLALAVWAARRHVLPVVARRRDLEATALRVEEADPQFGGRLVSRVEFRSPEGLAYCWAAGVSDGLVEAMCDRIERRASKVVPENIIDLKSLRRPVIAAVLAMILVMGVVFSAPHLTRIWLVRTLLPFSDTPWPRRTHLGGLEPEYRVRRGDTLTVSGRVTGEIPRGGELEWQAAAGETRTGLAGFFSRNARAFDVSTDGTFSATVGPLLEPIRLTVRVGDAQVEEVPVDVVTPPELASIEAVYTYPDFTGRQPERVRSGDVRALVGTQVELVMVADRPTERIELVFLGETERTEPVELESPLEGRAGFTIRERGRYQVRLFDPYGFSTDSPATFVLDPIDNELPAVRLTRPGAEHVATPATQLVLEFEASDDFGVTGAAVHWQLKPQEGQSASGTLSGEVPIPVGAPRKTWSARYVWDLATVRPLPAGELVPGDELEYMIVVRDAGEHLTDQKVGMSATQVLRITDPDSLRESLEVQLRESLTELDRLTLEQSASRDAVAAAMMALPAADTPLLTDDLNRLQREQNRQFALRRRLERLAERLANVADQLGESFLADADRVEEYRMVAVGLQGLSEKPMAEVVESLRQAHSVLAVQFAQH